MQPHCVDLRLFGRKHCTLQEFPMLSPQDETQRESFILRNSCFLLSGVAYILQSRVACWACLAWSLDFSPGRVNDDCLAGYVVPRTSQFLSLDILRLVVSRIARLIAGRQQQAVQVARTIKLKSSKPPTLPKSKVQDC
jgi:hypothetical protein